MAIILASSSPRRKELLRKSVSSFNVMPADIDESVKEKETPRGYVARMAKEKAMTLANSFPADVVIGCDTTVVLGNSIMGKPQNDTEAKFMLRRLSNLTHQVLTSVYIKTPDRVYQKTEVVDVKFYKLEEADIDNYIKTGEHRDKAGAYSIQGQGALFVREIKGDYYSIVGFPIGFVNQVMKDIEKKELAKHEEK